MTTTTNTAEALNLLTAATGEIAVTMPSGTGGLSPRAERIYRRVANAFGYAGFEQRGDTFVRATALDSANENDARLIDLISEYGLGGAFFTSVTA